MGPGSKLAAQRSLVCVTHRYRGNCVLLSWVVFGFDDCMISLAYWFYNSSFQVKASLWFEFPLHIQDAFVTLDIICTTSFGTKAQLIGYVKTHSGGQLSVCNRRREQLVPSSDLTFDMNSDSNCFNDTVIVACL
jgi:hypothetical protein